MRKLYSLLFLPIALYLSFYSLNKMRSLDITMSSEDIELREALYLPSGENLQLLSFGYQSTLAHLLWFRTISYFGKHYREDGKYRWFSKMCNLVTELNPKAEHVFHFCNAMLCWEANEPYKSISLLSKAIKHNSDNWNYYYLRGFTYMYFLKDKEKAQQDFVQGAKSPGAPAFLARLATKKLSELDRPAEALQLIDHMIQSALDPIEKQALLERRAFVAQEVHISILEKAIKVFQAEIGRFPKSLKEIVTIGILEFIPREPWGGHYQLDPETKEIKNSSGKKRLRKKNIIQKNEGHSVKSDE